MREETDVIVVGAGLAGLVAATEIADAGKRVVVLDQEPEQSLGGQAFWSLGGLFLVDSPEQRRMRVRDSVDLAWQDWQGTAGFDRDEDHWPKRWAEAYVAFAAGEKRAWLHAMGQRFFPVVGWAERGGGAATTHGNSVPRFHVTWGTGPGVVEPFARRARAAEQAGRGTFRFRHRVDGRMMQIAEEAGGRLINRDRMWHYVEGIENWNPIWPRHGIRILPGPSSLWFDATGKRLPAPLFPGSDTLGQLQYIMSTGYDYSWFILTQSIIKKEFALSGSEQNPDLTGKSWRMTIKRATNKGAPAPVEAFKQNGADFIVRDNLVDLVSAMNALAGNDLLQHDHIKAQIEARDREITNPYVKDAQVMNL